MKDEQEIIADALAAINALPASIGAQWYSVEMPVSNVAKADGRLRRIELWYLTDAAAEDNDLKKP